MSKKIMKISSKMLIVLMLFTIFTSSAFAATGSFSKSTVKLNAIDGKQSTISSFTSGSVLGTSPKITNVKVFLNVSSGSDPFEFYLVSPSGQTVHFEPSTKNNTYYLNDFNGLNPKGTWKAYIINSGEVFSSLW